MSEQLDRLLKDAAYWSENLEKTSKRLEPQQNYMHMNQSYENEFIVQDDIYDFQAYSANLAETMQKIADLQKTEAKKSFWKKLFRK